jgi:hypothetical protein
LGGAGPPPIDALARIHNDNEMNIGQNVFIQAEGTLNLLAGRLADGTYNNLNVTSHGDELNASAIPIDSLLSHGEIIQNHSITIGAGSDLKTARDTKLDAELNGNAVVTAYGSGKNWMTAVASGIDSLLGSNGVSEEMKGGTSTNEQHGTVTINGTIEVGIHKDLSLAIPKDFVNNGTAPTASPGITWTTSYSPAAGYRYFWEDGQNFIPQTITTYAKSEWLGIDALAADPGNIVDGPHRENLDAVPLREGEYIAYDPSVTDDYTYDYARIDTGTPTTIKDSWSTSTWYGTTTYYVKETVTQDKKDVHSHSILADQSIGIDFTGYDANSASVNVTVNSPNSTVELNNSVEVVDTRTAQQLLDLYGRMMATPGTVGQSLSDTTAAYEGLKTRDYQAYWQYRNGQTADYVGGLTNGQTYYVVSVAGNLIQLATSLGGPAIGVTASPVEGAEHRLYKSGGTPLTFDSVTDVNSAPGTIHLAAGNGLSVGDAVTYYRVVLYDPSYHVTLAGAQRDAFVTYYTAQGTSQGLGGTDLINGRSNAGDPANVKGGDIILEGGTGSIGAAAPGNAVVIQLAAGKMFTARAANDIYVVEHGGNMTIGEVFCANIADLRADGAILDGYNDDATTADWNVDARSIYLQAGASGTFGASGNFLEIDQQAGQQGRLPDRRGLRGGAARGPGGLCRAGQLQQEPRAPDGQRRRRRRHGYAGRQLGRDHPQRRRRQGHLPDRADIQVGA